MVQCHAHGDARVAVLVVWCVAQQQRARAGVVRLTTAWRKTGMTLLTHFGWVSAYSVLFYPDAVLYKLEVHRLVTVFFFLGGLGLPLLMTMFMLHRHSGDLENNMFSTTPGAVIGGMNDYVFALMFCAVLILVAAYFLGLVFLGPSLVFAVIYLWSRRNPEAPLNFWGFRFKGLYLPWLYLGMTWVLGGNVVPDLVGIAAGHVYYFLVEELPRVQGRTFLTTPHWLILLLDWINDTRTVHMTPGGGREVLPNRGLGGHPWGTGRRLND